MHGNNFIRKEKEPPFMTYKNRSVIQSIIFCSILCSLDGYNAFNTEIFRNLKHAKRIFCRKCFCKSPYKRVFEHLSYVIIYNLPIMQE